MREIRVRKVTLAKAIIGALITCLGLPSLSPEMAVASGSVTKTITVNDFNGVPLANALVTLFYEDISVAKTIIVPQTTNSSGVATFSVPKELASATYYVEPASGDILNSADALNTDLSANSADFIRLKHSTIVIDVQSPSNAEPYSGHYFYQSVDSSVTSLVYLTRSGPFGYYLPLTRDSNTYANGYVIGSILSQGGMFSGPADLFRWNGCISFTGSGPTKSANFFTDTSCTSAAPTSGGAVVLTSPGYNVKGQLRNSDGSAFTIPDAVTTQVIFNPSSPLAQTLTNDQILQLGLRGTGTVKSDGTFYARLYGNHAGEYQITVKFYGSASLPSFVTYPVWMDSTGKLSTTQTGTYTAATASSPFTFDAPISASGVNFKFAPVIAGTSTTVAGSWSISGPINEYGYGNGNLALTDGDYTLLFTPEDSQYASDDFSVGVSGTGSHIWVKNAHATSNYSSTDQAVFNLPVSLANFAFASVAPNEAHPELLANWTNGDASVCHVTSFTDAIKPDDCFGAGRPQSSGGVSSFHLPDGKYRMFLKPSNAPVDAESQFLITVVGGVVSLTTNAGTPVTSLAGLGIYALSTSTPNFNAQIVDPATNSAAPGADLWLYPTSKDYPGGYWPGYQFTMGSNGFGSAYLIDGDYVADLTSGDGTTSTFHVHVAGGVSTITESVTKNGANFILPVAPSNFKFSMPGGNTNSSQPAYYEICANSTLLNRTNCVGNGLNSTLTGGAHLAPGSYLVIVHPANDTLAVSNWTVNVASDGTVDVPTATQSGGRWVLAGATPNVSFEVHNPTDNSLLTDGWIGLGVKDISGNVTGWYPNADISSDFPGLTQAKLPDGNYLVQVSTGIQSLSLVSRSYDLAVAGGVPTLSSKGTAVSKNGDRYVVSLSNSNFAFQIVDPTNSNAAITDGWIDVCQDLGAGQNKMGSCSGTGVNGSGQGSLNIATGKWFVRVNPGAGENAASKVYSLNVDNSGVVTMTGVTAPSSGNPWVLAASTPNVSGQLTDGNGQPLVLTRNSNQGVNVQLQEQDSNGNWNWLGMGSWRQNSNYGLSVTSASDIFNTGHFRILAQPQNLPNFADTTSAEFWLKSDGTISATSATGTDAVTALTNFNIALKSPNLNLEVKNPIDNSDLPGGWVALFKVDPNTGNNQWYGNANISNQGDGLANAYLGDGTYQLQVNPQLGNTRIAGLTQSIYKATVSSNGTSISISPWGLTQTILKTGSRFVINAGVANITGRLVTSDGTALAPGNNQWVNINLQSQNSSGGWDYSQNWYNTDQNGNFSISANTPGTYRLFIQPIGYPSASNTYSSTFMITADNSASFKEDFGNLALAKPDLIVQVLQPGSTSPSPNININIFQNNQYQTNAWTGPNAVGSITFPSAGVFTLQLYPDSAATQAGFTQKTYTATVSVNNDGNKSVAFATDAGVGSAAGGIVTLALGTATVKGLVTLPDGTTAVANSQVVAYDSNGNGMWQFASQTSQNGAWAMSLPQGTYTLQAQPAYGDNAHGNSARLGTITVATDGSATLSGTLGTLTPATISLPLRNPTWSGTIMAPNSTDPVPFAQVCLVASANIFNCNQANENGQFAFTAPSDFTAFDESSQLQVQDVQGRQYASTFFQGAIAVSGALGGIPAPGASITGITIHMLAPNLQITVRGGTDPAPYVNVNLVKAGTNQWLGNAQTNSLGVANFNIPDLNQALVAQVDLGGNPTLGSNYAYTVMQIPATTAPTENVTVDLATPNIFGVVHAQSTGSILGAPIPYEWVELDSVDNQGNRQWIGSTSSDFSGKFAFFAPTTAGNHVMVIIHANQGGVANGTDSSYLATLSGGTVSSIVLSGTSTAATSILINGHTYYDFSLSSPNVTGTVKDPSGTAIANSWIQPFDVTHRVWLNSPNSDFNGNFGLSLPDGIYQLQANPPGYASNVAKSSICQVTVAGSTVTAASYNCNTTGSTLNNVQLKLHTPNLIFRLVAGSTPMANSNVNISLGAWNTWANADSNGQVSLYIDIADIALLNPGLSGTLPLSVWLNPPYGQSNLMVQSNCSSGQAGTPCQNIPQVTIGGSFNQLNLGDIAVKGPNTKLQIKTPGGVPVGQGYWINLVSYDTATSKNYRYLGGASTDSTGVAYFNLDTSTATANTVYGVSIYPSGNDSQTYTTGFVGDYQQYGDWNHGLTWSQLVSPSTLLAPSTPNAILTVTSGDGVTADRYGSINVTQVNSSGNPIRGWGYGLNFNGVASMLLPGNGNFKITAYANGVAGAPTTCTVSTNSANPVAISSATGCTLTAGNNLAMTLSLGNVHGTVVGPDNSTVLTGAIVVAQIGSDTSTAVTTSTTAKGAFGFNIDATKNYTITVISPVGTDYPTKQVPFTPASSVDADVPLGTIKLGS